MKKIITKKEKEQDEYRKNHVNLYIKEVINPLLPQARFSSALSIGSPEHVHFSAKIAIQNTNEVLKGSQYYLNSKTEFIHYTSFQNLLSILNDKSIRMFDFNYLNDPQEFIYGADRFKIPSIYNSRKDLKETLFSLSMCLYDEKVEKDSFDMWRLYGASGNGVGIVLDFDNSNREHWHKFYLSKIYYNDEDLQKLLDVQTRHVEFHKKYKFHVRDYHDILYPLLGFHKAGIYKAENEVRL